MAKTGSVLLAIDKIARFVSEYRAQVVQDERGNRFVAAFPSGVTRPVQYETNFRTATGITLTRICLAVICYGDLFQGGDVIVCPVTARSGKGANIIQLRQ